MGKKIGEVILYLIIILCLAYGVFALIGNNANTIIATLGIGSNPFWAIWVGAFIILLWFFVSKSKLSL